MNLLNLKRVLVNQFIFGIVLAIFFVVGVVLTILGFVCYETYLAMFGIVLLALSVYLLPYFTVKFIKNFKKYKVFSIIDRGIMSVTTISSISKLKREKTVNIIRELITDGVLVNYSFDGDSLTKIEH